MFENFRKIKKMREKAGLWTVLVVTSCLLQWRAASLLIKTHVQDAEHQ